MQGRLSFLATQCCPPRNHAAVRGDGRSGESTIDCDKHVISPLNLCAGITRSDVETAPDDFATDERLGIVGTNFCNVAGPEELHCEVRQATNVARQLTRRRWHLCPSRHFSDRDPIRQTTEPRRPPLLRERRWLEQESL